MSFTEDATTEDTTSEDATSEDTPSEEDAFCDRTEFVSPRADLPFCANMGVGTDQKPHNSWGSIVRGNRAAVDEL